MKRWKRMLALFLSMVMVLTTGITAFAEEIVEPLSETPVYQLTVNPVENGTLMVEGEYESTAENTYLIQPGTEVKVHVDPAEGYEIAQVLLTDSAAESELEVTDGIVTFTMPESDCSISAGFSAIPQESVEEETESASEEETADAQEEPVGEQIPSGQTEANETLQEEQSKEETKAQEEKTETADDQSNEQEEQEGVPRSIYRSRAFSLSRAAGKTCYVDPGADHEYGDWATCEFDVITDDGVFEGYCAEPNKDTPEGTFEISSYNNDSIKAILMFAPGGPWFDQAWWDAFGFNPATGGTDGHNDPYSLAHACIGYLYSGDTTGLSDVDVGEIQMYINMFNESIYAEYGGISFDEYSLYIAYNDSQDVVWIEPNPKGKLTLQKSSANPDLTDGSSCYSLQGAEYGVYKDSACQNQVGTLTTDAAGNSNTIEVTAKQYYVKELKAPKGYALDTKVYTVTVSGDKTATLKVKDLPQSDPVRIVLGKIDQETTKDMPQGSASLENAEFTVKYYDGFYDSDPAEQGVFPKRTWVLKTNQNGKTALTESLKVSGDEFYYMTTGDVTLPLGTITIQETKAPAGYLINDEVFVRQITSDGYAESVNTYNEPEIPEAVIRGGVRIEKWDNDLNRKEAQGTATLQGAQIQIISDNSNPVVVEGKTYNKGDVIMTLTTGADGSAATGSEVLPYGNYIAKESKSPAGYNNSGVIQRSFQIREQGAIVNLNTSATAIKNDVIRGGVRVEKWDNETNEKAPQGSATLEGAVFQIVSFNDQPVMVNGKEYQKNEVVAQITTDKEGVASTSESLLPYGDYILRESKAPEGYNNTGVIQRTFRIREEGVIVNMNETGTAIKNDVIRGDLQLVKIQEDYDEEEDQKTPLEGIIFTITSKTTGEVFKITTDENGYASTTQLGISDRGNLVYDTYVVHEENTPEGLKPVNDFEITISEEGRTLYYILEDKQIISPVTVVKVDSTTGNTIPVADTEFELLDKDKNVITMTTYYPNKVEHKTWKTDESGSFTFPQKLQYGTYYLREVNAPDGYLRGEDLKFEIKEGHEWEDPIEVRYADAPAMGRITVMKEDAVSGDALEGAEFTVTAAEDIITPDGTLRASAGEVVDTITSAADGTAQSKELFLGKYTIKETKQPIGYAINEKIYEVELKYKDQETPIVVESLTVGNQPTVIIIDKKVTGTEQHLSGVKFAVWNKLMDVEDGEDSIDPGMSQKLIVKTARDGQARIEKLAPGTYCIQEVQGVPGYAIDPTIHEVTIGEDGRIEGEDHIIVTVENAETEIVQTNAYDVETNTHTGLPQSSTTIRDIVSIENLQPGETYTLKGVIVNQENGLPIEPPAETVGDVFLDRSITSEVTFEATDSVMDVLVEFTFNSSEMDGLTLTVYEYLYQQDIEISNHTDLQDEKQQVTFPDMEIHTTALEQNTQSHEAYINEVGGTTSITDTVEITGIVPGLDYILKGVVMDQETGEPLLNADGEEITVEKVITPEESSLTVDMEFVLDSSELAGKSIVIFEYLYHNDEEIESHEDIDDEDQTVTFVTPEIHTTAIDQDTMLHQAYINEKTVIVDTVAYEGLADGENLKYILRGTPMDQETGKPLLDADGNQIWSEQEFTAEELEGSVDVTFEFDTSVLAGKSIVFYEYLYLVTEDGELPVTEHEDIEDEDQTVTFETPEIHTTALGKDSGSHEVIAKEGMVIIDTVNYKGIVADGKLKYVLRGTPMEKETGEPLLDADGNQIWVEKEFIPTEPNGSVEMEFTLDTSELNNKSIVIYEYLYLVTDDGEIPVAEHEDINDVDQTVQVKVGSLTATMPGNSGSGMRTVKTGDITNFLPYIVALLLAGTAVTVIVIRKRREGLKEHESQE